MSQTSIPYLVLLFILAVAAGPEDVSKSLPSLIRASGDSRLLRVSKVAFAVEARIPGGQSLGETNMSSFSVSLQHI